MINSKGLPTGIWDYDIDDNVLLCDARWHELLQLPFGTILRIEDFRRHIHPDDVEFATVIDVGRLAEMIVRDEHYHNDFRVIRVDGQVRKWRSVACLVIDPTSGHRRAVGCVTDLTGLEPADLGDTPTPAQNVVPDQIDVPPADLTARELECLHWVSLGKAAWETATIIGRSPRTVEFHLSNAVRKLGATNKIHAVVLAVRQKLI